MHESHILKSAYFNLALSFIHRRSMHLSYNFSQTKQITSHTIILSQPPFCFVHHTCPSIERDLLIVLTQSCISGILVFSKNHCKQKSWSTSFCCRLDNTNQYPGNYSPFGNLCCLLLFKLCTVCCYLCLS